MAKYNFMKCIFYAPAIVSRVMGHARVPDETPHLRAGDNSMAIILGTPLDDILDGTNDAGDTITGLGGNDTITPNQGDDVVDGGTGDDVLNFAILTDGADSINLGLEALDRMNITAGVATQVRLTFTSAEVGNGNANDSNTLANQDGGLAVRVQAEDGVGTLTGAITRTDDEGMIYIAGPGVTFDVRDLPSGVARGDQFEVAVLGTNADDNQVAVQSARPYYFNGGAGNDTMTGGSANDFFAGGAGNDRMIGGAGNNFYLGGGGIDTVDYSASASAVFVNLASGTGTNSFGGTDTFNTIENVNGGSGNNTLIGDANANVFTSGGGADYLFGGGGNDYLSGGSGAANTLQGGLGNDFYAVAANDTVIEAAGEGIDTVDAAVNSITLFANIENLNFIGTGDFAGTGNAENNTIFGATGADTLSGLAGSDYLIGLGGNDLLNGGTDGTNTLQGGVGDDIYITALGDSVVELGGGGTDTVQTSSASATLAANVENLIFTGAGDFVGIGNGEANAIRGGAGIDTLTGGAGADTFQFRSGSGRDIINDFLTGSDQIALETASFTRTANISFQQGAGPQTATTANSTFIYRSDTGTVSYDADGSGAGAAVEIAFVGTGLVLNAGDFTFY